MCKISACHYPFSTYTWKDAIIEYGNSGRYDFSPYDFSPSFFLLCFFLSFPFLLFPSEFHLPKRKQQFTYRVILRFSMQTECKEKWYAARRILSGLEGTRRVRGTRRVGALARHWSINRFRSNRTGSWSDLTRLWNDVTFVSHIVLALLLATPHTDPEILLDYV